MSELKNVPADQIPELARHLFVDPQNGSAERISLAGVYALIELKRDVFRATLRVLSQFNSFNLIDERFVESISFAEIELRGPASFEKSRFEKSVSFYGSNFFRTVKFDKSIFNNESTFEKTHFHDSATFVAAQFVSCAKFDAVIFHKDSSFANSTFRAQASFRNCQFDADANFNLATFASAVEFTGGKSKAISFDGVKFSKRVNFSDHEFLGKTSFANVTFGKAPNFHNCTFHQDTTFENANFPVATGSYEAILAYRTLKLTFSKQQAIREEQRFFKLEMAEEAARGNWWQRLPFLLYSWSSDYGFSIWRPLALFFISLLIFAGLYGYLTGLSACSLFENNCVINSEWLQFSALQALPLPGLEKLGADLKLPSTASLGFTLAVILHKTISVLALFLMGLALRNLFKLK